LKLSKQEAKFQMFKILAITLLIAYIFSFTLFIIELVAQWNNYFNSWWRGWFFFDAYWEILYLVILIIIAIIWRPTENNFRYAFSSQLADDPPPQETTKSQEMESVQL